MTYARIFSLALLILALGSLGAAASASALGGTTLCKVNETPCSAANHYGPGTEFIATSGNATLTRTWEKTSETIKCNRSQVKGKLTTTGSSSSNVGAQITFLDFTECVLTTVGGTVHACTDIPLNMPEGGFSNTPGTMNGTLTLGELSLTSKCPESSISCTFTASSTALDVIGGAEATLTASKESFKGSGGLCPGSLDWSGNYTFTAPTPLYLSQSL
jgi:hypothetical protein